MPGMNGLTQDELNTLNKLLEARERSLRAAMHDEFSKRSDTPDDAGIQYHETTDDDAIIDQLNDSAVRSMTDHAQSLNDVERSLESIASGRYGECSDCGCHISYARLTANPTATRCTPCQSQHEKGMAHPRM